MPLTPSGYPYPDPSDPPDGAGQLRLLAEAVEHRLGPLSGVVLQSGQVSVDLPTTAGSTTTQLITYPTVWATPPLIVLSWNSNTVTVSHQSRSVSGFSAALRRVTAGGAGTIIVFWLAIGETTGVAPHTAGDEP